MSYPQLKQLIELAEGFTKKLEIDVDFTSATWNTVATHELFTVTGLITGKLVALCSEDLASADGTTIQAGVAGATNAFIANTGFDAVDADLIWLDATPAQYEAIASITELLINDLDIGYEILVAALTDGTVKFILFWRPLEDGATVVRGAGGVL